MRAYFPLSAEARLSLIHLSGSVINSEVIFPMCMCHVEMLNFIKLPVVIVTAGIRYGLSISLLTIRVHF
jgi:hypothetical protein